jgi:hypothetical protein
MHITAKYGNGCSDATCPAIYDTDDPEMVGVQGTILTDPQALHEIGQVPPHETVVLLPRKLFEDYRSRA